MAGVRLVPQKTVSFTPMVLETDIDNLADLESFIKLFTDWDDDTAEVLTEYKDKMIMEGRM